MSYSYNAKRVYNNLVGDNAVSASCPTDNTAKEQPKVSFWQRFKKAARKVAEGIKSAVTTVADIMKPLTEIIVAGLTIGFMFTNSRSVNSI